MMPDLKNDEQIFLDRYSAEAFAKPSVTVDVVILTIKEKKLCALLSKRQDYPFKDYWSLIGGFVGIAESLDDAAKRVLAEKGNLAGVYLEQLYTFGDVQRDPRMRIISVSYYALTNIDALKESESVKLFEVSVPWEGETGGSVDVLNQEGAKENLAFDHEAILGMAIKRIRGKLEYVPLGFELLPERFTLRELQEVHEIILGKTLNKDAFRRKVLASGALEATGDFETGKGFRPAEYYGYKGD